MLLALAAAFAASTAMFNATYQAAGRGRRPTDQRRRRHRHRPPGTQVGPAARRAPRRGARVRHVEPLQHRFAYVGADLQDLYGVQPATITAAHRLQDAYFPGGTAASSSRGSPASPTRSWSAPRPSRTSSSTPATCSACGCWTAAPRQLITVPFHYAGIVKEFPTAPKDSFFVANATTSPRRPAPTRSARSWSTPAAPAGRRGRRPTRPARRPATVTDITQTRAQVGSSLTSVDLHGLTRLELVFAVLLAAGAGGIVLAVGLAERRRTLAIMAVLGADRRQLRGLVLGEGLLLAAGGLIGGAVIAWALARMLVTVLTGVFDPPPDAIAVPWTYLAGTAVAVVAAVAVAALISATGLDPARGGRTARPVTSDGTPGRHARPWLRSGS